MDAETISVIGTVMAAVAAVAAVVVSYVVYTGQCSLSKSIADDQSALSARIASEQLEGSSRPCVLVLEDADELREFSARNLILQNIGSGPALNIRWRLSAWSEWGTAPALSPGGFVRPALRATDVDAAGGAECEFESLSGKPYRTTAQYVRVPPNNTILLKHGFQDTSLRGSSPRT
jgi:hypothetical protein